MHYVLPLRDVIAASVELMIEAHHFDAALFLGTCDKIVPAMLMAAARVNLPSVFLTGGPMLPWFDEGRAVILSDVKEGMGALKAGRLTEEEFHTLECNACGGPGACAFMGTANTMNCLVEAMGLSLPGCSTLPAVAHERDGKAVADHTLCSACEACLDACATEAIVLAPQPRLASKAASLLVKRPEPEIVPVRTSPAPVALRARVLPVIGATLAWAGREILPRLADLLLDRLDRHPTQPLTRIGAGSRGTLASGAEGGRQRRRAGGGK